MNVLFVTIDQFRGDALSVAGHPVVRTPHLDALARSGVRFARHYSQAAPCSPGRASLYTGMYAMNHRVVANGTPLDSRFDNLAHVARRAGYRPTLFGYTDQSIDPRQAQGPEDSRLSTYEGVLPGFDVALHLPETADAWRHWLMDLGYDLPADPIGLYRGESNRPAEHGISAFLADRLIAWISERDGPWFAHASFLRPHPPYAAAGDFARAYDPDALPPPIAPAESRHPLHDAALGNTDATAPRDERRQRRLRAQYFGMVSAVDHEIGRLCETLRRMGQWDDTLIVVVSDHGEQLCDHGLIEKLGFFEQSYHVPCIVRDPRRPVAHGSVVESFTENVDLLPTLCEALGVPVPLQCDGLPLTPWLEGRQPEWWRQAAHWEWDWRHVLLRHGSFAWPWNRELERQHLAVRRDERSAYVQFGDGSWLCFDLAADPTWRTPLNDPAAVLASAQDMLVWRSQHTERTLTGLLLDRGPIGRWPDLPGDWHQRRPSAAG